MRPRSQLYRAIEFVASIVTARSGCIGSKCPTARKTMSNTYRGRIRSIVLAAITTKARRRDCPLSPSSNNQMSAKVDPAKLKPAINAKLGSAGQELYKLRESDKPVINQFPEPEQYAIAFLHAARGVYPTIKTFANAQFGKAAFEKWVYDWEAARSTEDRTLWRQMRVERIDQKHGEGARLLPHMIEVTNDRTIAAYPAAVGLVPVRNKSWKGGQRCKSYPNLPISQVCKDYLALCQRFVDKVLHDHASPVP